MTIYNLAAAPSLMMADLLTVPSSSAVLYEQGASLHWNRGKTVGMMQENHIREILSTLLEHIVLITGIT